MVSSSGTNVFLIPTVHYTTCSVADLFWPGRPRAPKRSHVTGLPQMQLEIPITPNHLGHSAVPKARAPAGTAPGLLDRLSALVPLGQFPTSGAKLCIFHHWDLYPRGKLKQILVFSAISPVSRSSGAVVLVAWEGWRRDWHCSEQARALQQHGGVCCWLTLHGETGGPL